MACISTLFQDRQFGRILLHAFLDRSLGGRYATQPPHGRLIVAHEQQLVHGVEVH